MLETQIKDELLELYHDLQNKGQILTEVHFKTYYENFRNKFHPERLQKLQGEKLLDSLFNLSNRDSMAYWLEFKNDQEFPAVGGSIAGGSALKWGVYLKSETGTWFTGSPTKQRELSLSEAVQIAEKYKNVLLAGYNVIENMSSGAADEEYINLQKKMSELADDIANYAWLHKYYSIMFPEKLEDFHNTEYSAHSLIKLFIPPVEGDGKYLNGGKFVALAKELNLPLHIVTSILYHRNGKPHRYWRIGTTSYSDENNDRWALMKDGSCIAVGYDEINVDLSEFTGTMEGKNKLRAIIEKTYPTWPANQHGRQTTELFNFINSSESDIVVAMNGSKVNGIAKVVGSYYFEPSATYFRHRRKVKWLSLEEWKMEPPRGKQQAEGLLHTFVPLKYSDTKIQIEKKIQANNTEVEINSGDVTEVPELLSVEREIFDILERKGQVILYGPPGTGKSYWAEKLAKKMAAWKNYKKTVSSLSENEQNSIQGNSDAFVRMCTFHPNYGYEDFLEGFRPKSENNTLSYVLVPGIFSKICDDAHNNPYKNYFLIIDEINRGDIPRIFGELITVIEKDKRGKKILLPLSQKYFSVPGNLQIIATMNTADRSIALLDTALRRRFGFYELLPDTTLFSGISIDGLALGSWLKALNKKIAEEIGQNGRNLQIGHSFFLEKEKSITEPTKFLRILKEDIIPLLEEYCYEDYKLLEKFLGRQIVNVKEYRIDYSFIKEENWSNLLQALISVFPEILTNTEVLQISDKNKVISDEDENE